MGNDIENQPNEEIYRTESGRVSDAKFPLSSRCSTLLGATCDNMQRVLSTREAYPNSRVQGFTGASLYGLA